MTDYKPRRIEWAGPESWVVWTDEDGTHLRAPQGQCLEMPDVAALFALWQHAREVAAADHIPAPKPPTRDEVRAWSLNRQEQWVAQRAVTAVKREFDDAPTGWTA